MRFFSSRERGFTLAEVLVVLSILALLMAVVLGNLAEGRKKAHDTQRVSDLAQLQLALRLNKDADGSYPAYDSGDLIGDGIGIDADFSSNVSGIIKDPLDIDPHRYYYDSDYDACGGANKKILIAQTMERSSSANYASVCGGSYDDLGNGVTPTADSYVVILK